MSNNFIVEVNQKTSRILQICTDGWFMFLSVHVHLFRNFRMTWNLISVYIAMCYQLQEKSVNNNYMLGLFTINCILTYQSRFKTFCFLPCGVYSGLGIVVSLLTRTFVCTSVNFFDFNIFGFLGSSHQYFLMIFKFFEKKYFLGRPHPFLPFLNFDTC